MENDIDDKKSNSNTQIFKFKEYLIPQKQKGNICFLFYDNTTSYYSLSSISCINPIFFSSMTSQKKYEIKLPNFITPSMLLEFLFIVKNGLSDLAEYPLDNSEKIITLTKISEFFQNENIAIQIIAEIAIKKVSSENAFIFLNYAYNKLNSINDSNFDGENIYFDLFYRCLEIIGENLDVFFLHLEEIKRMDSKIVEEIIQKMVSHLIMGNFIKINTEEELIEDNNSFDDHSKDDENYFETYNNNLKNPKNEKINKISCRQLGELIKFLYTFYNCKNFFDLLTSEYSLIFSNESINELNSLPNPTFQIKIPNKIDNFYEEYPIDLTINNKNIIFVLYYKKNEDSFNICIKLSDCINSKNNYDNKLTEVKKDQEKIMNIPEDQFFFKIFTFLTIVKINKENITFNTNDEINTQTNLKSLSSNKIMHSIFKLENFKSIFYEKSNKGGNKLFKSNDSNKMENNCCNINQDDFSKDANSIGLNDGNFFTVTIFLKFCYIHSVLSSYLLSNFSALSKEKSINKISKQLLILIIKNKFLQKKKEDDVLIGILNWLNDEINSKEDITELFDYIRWEKISKNLILEFLIKYSHMISYEDFGKYFFKDSSMKINDLLSDFYKSIKEVKYNEIYTKMKKAEKYNAMLISTNQSHLLQSQDLILQNKESTSFSKGNQSYSNPNIIDDKPIKLKDSKSIKSSQNYSYIPNNSGTKKKYVPKILLDDTQSNYCDFERGEKRKIYSTIQNKKNKNIFFTESIVESKNTSKKKNSMNNKTKNQNPNIISYLLTHKINNINEGNKMNKLLLNRNKSHNIMDIKKISRLNNSLNLDLLNKDLNNKTQKENKISKNVKERINGYKKKKSIENSNLYKNKSYVYGKENILERGFLNNFNDEMK